MQLQGIGYILRTGQSKEVTSILSKYILKPGTTNLNLNLGITYFGLDCIHEIIDLFIFPILLICDGVNPNPCMLNHITIPIVSELVIMHGMS